MKPILLRKTTIKVNINFDFIEENSGKRLTAQLNENDEYSIQLVPGEYRTELTYTIGGVVSPIQGDCGKYNIDTDKKLDLTC